MKIVQIFRHLCALNDLFQCWLKYRMVAFKQNVAAADIWAIPGFVAWAKRFLLLYRVKPTIQGQENLDLVQWENRHVFFLGNHQSYADIPAVLYAANRPVGFMAKKELWRIPFLGFWMVKLGCIGVDRSKPSSAIRTLKDFEKKKQHKQLVLFPEGTRSKNGKLGAFKDGGLKLVWSLKPIVVPFVIEGTRNGFENRTQTWKYENAIVRLLAPQDIADLSKEMDFNTWKNEFEHLLQKHYLEVKQELQLEK